jgi:arylformamidase
MTSTQSKNLTTPTPTPPHKGEGKFVWRDLDQKALDDAYDQDIYAPNRPLIVTRRIAAAERARAILGQPERVAYGPSEYERLDIFRAKTPNAPINVFVHGGAWRRNRGPDYHALAEPLVRAGASAVILDFINVEQANGDLMPMYEQVRRALAWTWRNAEKFGGDRDRLYISAHSSGSHLAACVLTDGWQEEGLPKDFCKGALLLSGMYDLEPVPLSKRSSYVKFTDAMVEKLSSQRHLEGLHTPLVLAYGTCETPEFQRQTKDFLAAVRALGKPAELIVGEAYNHFELLETIDNPYGLIGRAMLQQMGLA